MSESTLTSPPLAKVCPFVSVVMPVRNEGRFITRSLGAVLRQDYPAERMEVIVADGMSTDGTAERIRELQQTHPHLHLQENPGRIVATGLNAATARAKGEIIVRVDGHCEVAPDYVRRCVEHIQRDGVDGVGGAIETIGETAVARTIALAMSSPFGVGNSSFRTVRDMNTFADTVPFPAYTRSAIERSGPYDEEFVRNQDDEYNYRMRKRGGRLLLAADVRSRYYSRSSLRSLWRQYFQYGYWKVRVMQKHPWQMRWRQFVPACFVLALLACALAVATPWRAWPLGGLILLYAVANLSASFLTGRKHGGWQVYALLPLCFAIVHVAYGCGFLVGLVRFCHRWRGETEPWLIRPQITQPT